MRYQVGRACAAAGYIDLYDELNILPDVSIAEEARDSENNAGPIFDKIMGQPTNYAIMDDYSRTVNLDNPRPGAYLNADTAVRSLLDIKIGYKQQKHKLRHPYSLRSKVTFPDFGHFNITEDWGVDLDDSERSVGPYSAAETLLYSPLPADLPHLDKDLLILFAAYSGNIDRYVRLRRPKFIHLELECVVRGIYHDTMFAKWWSV
jgi:hypothetical protein